MFSKPTATAKKAELLCDCLKIFFTHHLFKVALHWFVRQQQDGPHQISHQDEISFSLQVQGHDIIVVVTLGPELLLSRPLIQTDLKQTVKVRNCSHMRYQMQED